MKPIEHLKITTGEYILRGMPVDVSSLNYDGLEQMHQLSRAICNKTGYMTLAGTELKDKTIFNLKLAPRPNIIFNQYRDSLFINPNIIVTSDESYPNLEHGIWQGTLFHFFMFRPNSIQMQAMEWKPNQSSVTQLTETYSGEESAQVARAAQALNGMGPWDLEIMANLNEPNILTVIARARGWRTDDRRMIDLLQHRSPFLFVAPTPTQLNTVDYRNLKTL